MGASADQSKKAGPATAAPVSERGGSAFASSPLAPQGVASYWLTRFIILRLLGFIYFFAFLAAANQIVPLVGEQGLLPAKVFLERMASHFGSRTEGFFQMPSVFWFADSDRLLVTMAWIGVALAAIVMLGYANAILMALLWGLYLSFCNIGQDWYGYGW